VFSVSWYASRSPLMRSSDSRLASCSVVVPSGFAWSSEGSGLEGSAV
jgi:hypothetical protein